jgi:transcriptional regulator with XRE-family HTH domain
MWMNAEERVTTATGFARGVAARVRQAREEAGLSVEDIMASTGLSRQVIDDAQDLGEVSTASLEILARATGRPMDYFLFPEDEQIEVMLRAGDASSQETAAAIRQLARLIRDYEFLRSIT